MRVAATAFLLVAALSIPALADDRAPTADERARIEAVLKAEGFTGWGEIELDDDRVWEVDDARHSDGKKYDLELDRTTLAITDRDED
ncbi:MAG: PepSY domain-containing protein [Mesorhizobium sp.]|nr:PepSY domain-containing protein [Mesorhizobium sp.]